MRIERLVIGSTNPGKIKEWKLLLKGFPLVSIAEVGKFPEPQEDGQTFSEIAKRKAKHYARLSKDFVLAEDGGFEIDFLDGAPGVKSRRVLPGDKEGTDQELIDFVMDKLKGVPESKRGAKLITSVVLADPKGRIIYEDMGEIRGEVPLKASPNLEPGYPYRSVFFIPGANKYYVDLTEGEHRKFNHRSPVARRLAKFLLEYK